MARHPDPFPDGYVPPEAEGPAAPLGWGSAVTASYSPAPTRPADYAVLAYVVGLIAVMELALWAIGGPTALADGLQFLPHRGMYSDVVVVWGMMIPFPILAVIGALRGNLRRIDVSDAGLRLVSSLGSTRIPWEQLQPPLATGSRSGNRFVLGYGASFLKGVAGIWPDRTFAVDGATLRAILSHRGAARSRLPKAYRFAAGLLLD